MPRQRPKPGDGTTCLRALAARASFAVIKLPLIFLLMVLGFIFELIIQLPFSLRIGADGRRRVQDRHRGV